MCGPAADSPGKEGSAAGFPSAEKTSLKGGLQINMLVLAKSAVFVAWGLSPGRCLGVSTPTTTNQLV